MRDAHASGRFTATDRQRAAVFAVLADRANVAGVTEDRGRVSVKDWKREANPEANVYWQDPWEHLDDGILTIPTPQWTRGTARVAVVEVRWVLLRHRDEGWLLLRASVHLPAHLWRPAQRRAHRAACPALAETLEELRVELGADEATLSGDFNVDLRRRSNRASLERRGYKVVAPKRGTHGIRTIDGFLTTMRGTARRLHRIPGYDHRAVVGDLHRTKEHQ